jgi:hypothetical protein
MLPYIMTTLKKQAEAAGIKNPEMFYPDVTDDDIAGRQAAPSAGRTAARSACQIAQQKIQADSQIKQAKVQGDQAAKRRNCSQTSRRHRSRSSRTPPPTRKRWHWSAEGGRPAWLEAGATCG